MPFTDDTYSRSSTVLTVRAQQVHVVGANERLRQVNNGTGQALLSVVVGGLLRDVTDELRNLDFGLHLALEATKYDFALTRLQTVYYRRDGTDVIRHGVANKLLVDEVGDTDLVDIMIDESPGLAQRVSGDEQGAEIPLP